MFKQRLVTILFGSKAYQVIVSTAFGIGKLYKIITDDIDNQFIKDRVNHTGRDELRNREITIDTKGQFPTKI